MEKEKSSINLAKITTLIVCLLPILSIYKFIPGINLGEAILILLVAIIVFVKFNKISNVSIQLWIWLIFSCFMLLNTLVSGMFLSPRTVINSLIRVIRFSFYALAIFVLISADLLNKEFLIKCVKIIGLISAIFVIIQTLLYSLTGNYYYFVLRRFIYSSDVYNESYYATLEKFGYIRSAGLFLEPAHFCQYALINISMLMLNTKLNRKSLINLIVSVIAILLSTSGIGYVCLAVLFVLLVFRAINSPKRFSLFVLLGIVMLALIIIIVIDPSIIKNTLSRFIDSNKDSIFESDAFVTRFGTYFPQNNSLIKIIFGSGYGNTIENKFYASIAYILQCGGIFGLLIFGCLLVVCIKNKIESKERLSLIITIILLLLFTDILMNTWVVFILPLLLMPNKEKKSSVAMARVIELNV